MINFRFHIASLIAVFLAVGLGILVGSTVVDQKIVNRLDSEIRSVRDENSQRKDANKKLTTLNSQQQDFIDLAAPFVVDARLDGQSVAIVAERGVDSGVLKKTETLLRSAGADVPAVLWLDDSWKLDTSQHVQDLQSALGLHGGASSTRVRALDLLARRLAVAPAATSSRSSTASTARSTTSTTSRTTPATPRVDVLTELEDAGFVSVTDGDASELATFPAHVAHAIFVTGDDSHFVGTDLTTIFARSLTRAHLPTVVAAIYDAGNDAANAPDRGATLASIIDDQELTKEVSTVDDLDLTQGRVGAVLALEVVGNGDSGHYGYGAERERSAPAAPVVKPVKERSVARAAAGMGGVTAVSRLAGFARVLVIAAVLGTTYLGNTFQAANSVSNVLFELLAAGALSAVLVPTFVTLLDAGDDGEAERLANGLLAYALVAMGVITVAGLALSPLLARLLSSGAPNAHIGAQQRHLATFLLWFFLPQTVLYAFGAIATGLLYARRRFAVTAAAPMGSSFVMIVCFAAFRVLAGGHPGFDLTAAEKALLAVAGTGGVIAFVGILMIAARRAGFSLRPRWDRGDPELSRFSRLAVWGVLLHSGAGMLLGAAIVAGNGVAGGVVAYQVAFTFFLAPYAVLAQPIHTAILPEMAHDVAAGDLEAFSRSIRWSLDRMAWLVMPVSAGLVAIALPLMRLVAFGSASKTGPALLAAGIASLALGLFPYGAFLLLARSYYALGDSRTPAIVAIISAVLGVATMVVGSRMTHGATRVAALGIGHSTAYLIGVVVLAVGCRRRTGGSIIPRHLPIAVGIAATISLVAWFAMRSLDPSGRIATVGCLALVGAVGTGVYVLAVRHWWRAPNLIAHRI